MSELHTNTYVMTLLDNFQTIVDIYSLFLVLYYIQTLKTYLIILSEFLLRTSKTILSKRTTFNINLQTKFKTYIVQTNAKLRTNLWSSTLNGYSKISSVKSLSLQIFDKNVPDICNVLKFYIFALCIFKYNYLSKEQKFRDFLNFTRT